MGKVQAHGYDDYDRIRYFYYIRPPHTPVPADWWVDPMATTTESVTTLSASEETTLLLYDIFIPLLGSLIIVLNLIVVVSGVLLLRKGQQPYTTYMFLGNVAVSDLLTGFAVIFGQYAPRERRAEENCTLMIGLIVSTSLVSVYSVGLIAIDRYLYIVYGLQYQRYLTRTRARILIAATWILGATIGFLPALGWRGDTDGGRTCWFIRLAPPGLVILTAVVGILPVLLVIILYGIILQKALRRVNQLKKASRELRGVQTGNLRLFRGGTGGSANGGAAAAATATITPPVPIAVPPTEPNRSGANRQSDTEHGLSEDELTGATTGRCLCLRSRCCTAGGARAKQSQKALNGPGTAATAGTAMTTTAAATTAPSKSPTKWKAIKVVMFTTGSFVVTWVPYFIASLLYVGCDPATNEELCRSLQFAIASPLAILGFANSLLNPIIYAWWHNGFRASMKRLAGKVSQRICCCCGGDTGDGGAGRCTAVRCCHKSSRSAPPSASVANRISANGVSSTGSTSDGIGPDRLSNRTVTTTVGQRAHPVPYPHSDQEFSITDDTDVEQPSMVIGTRL
ncbi:5-hydroxytryptamine receptor 1A-alpha-like [Anopheles arabiensis]|uniref:G-protein coupled receptors family 1 profile domain-containing protein n=1 Tax=Anopheles arabiensis TaxID=7173 RepID=A0A2Y9D0U9_ANOAR|nr:5-hydroxytryptamine receptor 1A-alpha-like [Anopheles arabiensis]XP_040153020.1 5-hydroxytryptamine receptor 1A-alpha-like [Anopheles arabiensis]XP_040153021.1 5-hydroxytryptamine receptor 1A-alpha-like [Anopheles arabiensis]XP_040153022.1 5-hydroxytryptamine receptor 1A-alpha-like [Anopheles arabiensis]XP_040153023.1 5-hydroxytryptamine receptor 1A-alpha-like [Anopheles arabiensis]XP_040153024.1 5-hydroxytryptamine receptor 1A-alpha-like [Anopheles arabiensis]XP_040153025.1 5-hydroxytrypt